ncbi:MAG: fibronectin type III domain-containing protein [Chromatiales bacterium]|nr:fibronectin type III domain-containing protein [Chromatiales bacterium]
MQSATAALRVPGDYRTVAAALDAIQGGLISEREIVLGRGTWNEAITLSSSLPPGVILRGEETARTIMSSSITVAGAINERISYFTFTSSSPGVNIESGTVTVANNIFRYDTGSTALTVVSAQPTITNNVFVGGTAIAAAGNVVAVESNAFINTDNSVRDGELGTSISNNAFFGVDAIGENRVTSDPLFVGNNDFHLRAGSPLIDAGIGTDIFDGSTADIGAYGGEFSDVIPQVVQDLSVVSVQNDGQENTAELRWSPNLWYLTGGYRLYYDTEAGAPYGGTGIDQGNSPIDVGDVSSITLSGLRNLDPDVAQLAAPELVRPQPQNTALVLSWSAVTGATGYAVHYRADNDADNDNEEHTVDVGNVLSYTLSGLVNGVDYHLRVSAYAQGAYYFVVTSYPQFDTAVEGEFSSEALAPVGPRVEGPLSNEVVDFPEAIEVFPGLPDKHGGCFIATAAYGFYGADEVRLLRRFRDHYLLTNAPGRAFVAWYYEHSPHWAKTVRDTPLLKSLVRVALMPAIALAAFLFYVPAAVQGIVLLLALLLWVGYVACRLRAALASMEKTA